MNLHLMFMLFCASTFEKASLPDLLWYGPLGIYLGVCTHNGLKGDLPDLEYVDMKVGITGRIWEVS